MSKEIQVIAWFDTNGKITPIKFKYEEESVQVICINKILSRTYEKVAGGQLWNFKCSSLIEGIEKLYTIKYDLINGKWMLFI